MQLSKCFKLDLDTSLAKAQTNAVLIDTNVCLLESFCTHSKISLNCDLI